ncbi:hypothetical protein [Rhodocista pekingensis]|uniref:Phosphatidate cytidylyltransferase n=1 Tax=Rhodocista pekingensis TaxID=201185 RepID=A0ABW2KRA9_9PROT
MTSAAPETPAAGAAEALVGAIAAELAEPVPPAATALALDLVRHGGGSVAAVLFYGSVLRTGDLDGVLDFYVIVDSLTGWHGRGTWQALANRLLPPNVFFHETPWQGRTVRAKVAVMSRSQFERAVRPDSLDTTIWARFAQPVRLVHARDADAGRWAAGAVTAAVATAAWWAARLGPESGTPVGFWDALFRHTYAAELRVEKGDRASGIVGHAADRYAALFRPALTLAGTGFDGSGDGILRPDLTAGERDSARRRWRRRQVAGKLLNVARLVKAAFTFRNGVDYIAWKVERHSGVRLALAPWQRRWPLLAAPGLLWFLWRRGAIR